MPDVAALPAQKLQIEYARKLTYPLSPATAVMSPMTRVDGSFIHLSQASPHLVAEDAVVAQHPDNDRRFWQGFDLYLRA